ncbi:MAG: hypothetical protein HFJ12_02455 [Bacilli bacterium]|nr:hypothetical protein [Bacilli bacterium]
MNDKNIMAILVDNLVNESLNGRIKEKLIIDFNLKHCKDVLKLIEE